MTNNISFKAQFIKPVYIKRVIDKNNSKCLASFVELNQANINDMKYKIITILGFSLKIQYKK